jgi:hypothetical protein
MAAGIQRKWIGMKDQKVAMMNGASQLVIMANDKGGQGKTLASLVVADHAHLNNAPLAIAQVDTQDRLARTIGRSVLTISAVPREARRDPGADARSFTPFYHQLERVAARRANALLDVGANQVTRFANWAGIVELEEDLESWGFETTIMIPFVAEGEGIRQAGMTAGLLLQRFPQAKLVLVQNERDGEFAHLHEASDAAAVYRASIDPLMKRATLLRIPAVEAGSWRPFEAAHCRLMDVPMMPIRKVMALTGLPRPESKISRGDVAAWTAVVFAELDQVLNWATREAK